MRRKASLHHQQRTTDSRRGKQKQYHNGNPNMSVSTSYPSGTLSGSNLPITSPSSASRTCRRGARRSRARRGRSASRRPSEPSAREWRRSQRTGWGHLGGPTRPGRQAGWAHVSVPTLTLSAGRPLPCRRADFPKPACRECQGGWVIARRRSRYG